MLFYWYLLSSLLLVSGSFNVNYQNCCANKLEGSIAQDKTISGTVLISGDVVVPAPYSLTILKGTTLKMGPGAALIISQGARIYVQGTSEYPVTMVPYSIFQPFNYQGLVIAGKASVPVNSFGVIRTPMAAYPYGGDIDNDNSGSIKWMLFYGGGLVDLVSTPDTSQSSSDTLIIAGVGSQTEIQNVFMYNVGDDGIEVFGGTVDLDHVFVLGCGDDGLDTDHGYSGTISNFIVDQTQGSGLEISAPNSWTDGSIRTISGAASASVQAKTNAALSTLTIVITGLYVDDTGDREFVEGNEDAGVSLTVNGVALTSEAADPPPAGFQNADPLTCPAPCPVPFEGPFIVSE